MKKRSKLPKLSNGLSHQVRKRFGQNFLHDEEVIAKIWILFHRANKSTF